VKNKEPRFFLSQKLEADRNQKEKQKLGVEFSLACFLIAKFKTIVRMQHVSNFSSKFGAKFEGDFLQTL
jgi:hypothetical protein